MSFTIRCPDAKAMELGGVDTGSMKAYEQPTVAGTMKYRGFIDTRIAYRDKVKTESTTFLGWDENKRALFHSFPSITTVNVFYTDIN